MTIHFYLRYHTRYGQTIFVTGNSGALGNDKPADAVALSYLNTDFWYAAIEIAGKDQQEINYLYILREEGTVDILDADKDRIINPQTHRANEFIVIDTWNAEGDIKNAFYTKPFQQVLLPQKGKPPKLKEAKFYTHEIK